MKRKPPLPNHKARNTGPIYVYDWTRRLENSIFPIPATSLFTKNQVTSNSSLGKGECHRYRGPLQLAQAERKAEADGGTCEDWEKTPRTAGPSKRKTSLETHTAHGRYP